MSSRATIAQTARTLANRTRFAQSVAPRPSSIGLHLLDSFRLTIDGIDIAIPQPAQRLLALLSLRKHPMLRTYAAGTLWLDAPEDRAAANLRSVLWRLRSLGVPVIDTGHGIVGLMAGVTVDLYEAAALARRWLAGTETEADVEAGSSALEGELLPDWYEDWAAEERDRFRQLRVHALEAIAGRLAAVGRLGDALLAALSALAADPLRESAHGAVIKIYLAEGNVAEAIRQLRRCEQIMIEEVGVPPSSRLNDLIRAGSD